MKFLSKAFNDKLTDWEVERFIIGTMISTIMLGVAVVVRCF